MSQILIAARNQTVQCFEEEQIYFICSEGFKIVRKALNGKKLMNMLKYDSLGCAALCPGAPVTILGTGVKTCFRAGFYGPVQWKFLNEVSTKGALNQSGIVMFLMADDSTLQQHTLQALHHLGIVFLRHSSRHRRFECCEVDQPDYHFLDSMGFVDMMRNSGLAISRPLMSREPKVFWRGSDTNPIQYALCNASVSEKLTWIDAKITNAFFEFEFCHNLRPRQMYIDFGVFENRSANTEADWFKYRGIVDMDGFSHAFGLHWRMFSGSVVFRVQGDFHSRFLDEMVPWIHYVPIRNDLSDLAELTKLVMGNQTVINQLAMIAANAKELTERLSYDNQKAMLIADLNHMFQKVRPVLPSALMTTTASTSTHPPPSNATSTSNIANTTSTRIYNVTGGMYKFGTMLSVAQAGKEEGENEVAMVGPLGMLQVLGKGKNRECALMNWINTKPLYNITTSLFKVDQFEEMLIPTPCPCNHEPLCPSQHIDLSDIVPQHVVELWRIKYAHWVAGVTN